MAISDQELKARIEYARTLAGFSKTELADLIEMHPNTFRRKMERPSKFTLEEFFLLSEVLPNNILIEYLKEEINQIKKDSL